jgi:hypothetical protein
MFFYLCDGIFEKTNKILHFNVLWPAFWLGSIVVFNPRFCCKTRTIISRVSCKKTLQDFYHPLLRVIQPVVPMTKRIPVLAAMLWLLPSYAIFAQISFVWPTVTNTMTNQELDLPLTVVNFDNVVSIQFTIQWNPSVVAFQDLEFGDNPLNLIDSIRFNVSDVSQGIIRFRWNGDIMNPRTLLDGDTLFRLKMKVVGANGTSTAITLDQEIPTLYFEVLYQNNGQTTEQTLVNTPVTNGLIEVGMVSIWGATDANDVSQVSIAPNPFSDRTSLIFNLLEQEIVTCYITDVSGRVLFQRKSYHASGSHGMEIACTDLPQSGLYFVHLITNSSHVVRPIVLR